MEVKCTVPLYERRILLLLSSAVTVKLNGVPEFTEVGADTEKWPETTLTVKVPVPKWHPVESVPVTVKTFGPREGGTPAKHPAVTMLQIDTPVPFGGVQVKLYGLVAPAGTDANKVTGSPKKAVPGPLT